MRAVLGLKLDPWHDTGAAIVQDGPDGPEVVAISQERLDRQKHSRAFPAEAIAYCLDAAGCRLQDLDLVVADFIARPGVDDQWSASASSSKRDFFQRLETLGVRVCFAEHHLCHAASAYFATDWDEAAALVIDGHGSWHETQTLFRCEGFGLTKVASSHRPGIGWMNSAATEVLLGFGHLQEGKTMGLAGWAAAQAPPHAAFEGESIAGNPFSLAYESLLDARDGWRLTAPADLSRRRPDEDPLTAPFPQYAAGVQLELQQRVLDLARASSHLVPSRRLCYSGGVALNIIANRMLRDSGLFDETFIQPAASDAGIPLGAALLGYYSYLRGARRRWTMTHAFLGRSYPATTIEAAAAGWDGECTSWDAGRVAQLLANDYLVAWVEDRAEYGPRALGHRSILCLPRHPRMKAYLNREVKHREMFRPFAPIVPAEVQGRYFDLKEPSRYMLINSRVHAEVADAIPAVVHADGTARVQAIDRADQPLLHALLEEVGRVAGVPILLNTSLNLAGEPIVETPNDAVALFRRSRLDALVLGHLLLTKTPVSSMLQRPNPGLAAMPHP